MTDRLERDLDAWWDADVLGDPSPPLTTALSDEIDAIRNLQASSPAAPTPAFATSLWVDLMMTATKMQNPPRPARFGLRAKSAPPAIAPRPTPLRSRRRRFAWLEIAAASLIIFGLLGAAYGGGVFDRFPKQNLTAIPAVLGANAVTPNAASTATAVPTVGSANVQGDGGRSGAMLGPAPGAAPFLAWKQTFGAARANVYVLTNVRLSAPAYDNGLVFVIVAPGDDPNLTPADPAYPDALIAMDVATGKQVWTAKLAVGQYGAPLSASQGIVVAETSSGVVGFKESDGRLAWSYSTGSALMLNSALPIDGDTLVLALQDGTIRVIDLQSGTERWRKSITAESNDSAYASVSNGIIYAASLHGQITALDANDGHVTWTAKVDDNLESDPVVANGAVYLATYVPQPNKENGPGSGRLYALEALTGKQLWEPKTIDTPFRLSAAGGLVFTAPINPFSGALVAIDGKTSKQQWTDNDIGSTFTPISADGELFYPGLDGRVKNVNATNGDEVWSVYLDHVSDPIVAAGLLMTSGDGALFAVGGNDISAAATPTTENDFSGLPACAMLRPIPTAKISGKPAQTVDVDVQLNDPSGASGQPAWVPALTHWPEMLTENLPPGKAATSGQSKQMQGVIDAMAACVNRADGYQSLAGFFADDFYRRGVAGFYPSFGYMVPWFSLAQQINNGALSSTVVLKDGRIAAHYSSAFEGGVFVIFAKQDGKLMIDEVYRVLDQYNWTEPG